MAMNNVPRMLDVGLTSLSRNVDCGVEKVLFLTTRHQRAWYFAHVRLSTREDSPNSSRY